MYYLFHSVFVYFVRLVRLLYVHVSLLLCVSQKINSLAMFRIFTISFWMSAIRMNSHISRHKAWVYRVYFMDDMIFVCIVCYVLCVMCTLLYEMPKKREFQTRSVCAVHLFSFSISFDHINGFSATSVRCRHCVYFTTATIATNSIIPVVHRLCNIRQLMVNTIQWKK